MITRTYTACLTKEQRLQLEKAVVKGKGVLKRQGDKYTVHFQSAAHADNLPELLRSYGEPWTDPVDFSEQETNGGDSA